MARILTSVKDSISTRKRGTDAIHGNEHL